jgi:hypothetical protein
MVDRVRMKERRQVRVDYRKLAELQKKMRKLDALRAQLDDGVGDMYKYLDADPALKAVWCDFMAAGGVTGDDLSAYRCGEFLRDVKRAPYPDFRLIVSNPVEPPAKPLPQRRRRVA